MTLGRLWTGDRPAHERRAVYLSTLLQGLFWLSLELHYRPLIVGSWILGAASAVYPVLCSVRRFGKENPAALSAEEIRST